MPFAKHAVTSPPPSLSGFTDLLTRNAGYQTSFLHGNFDGIAHAGVAMVTDIDFEGTLEPRRIDV